MKKHRSDFIVFAFAAAFAAFSLSSYAALPPGSFSRKMPESTGEKPVATPYGELAGTFRNPFGKVETGAYWYWLSGNLSVDGVKKDLAAMKRAGIERAYIGDINEGSNPPGPVKTLSPEWYEAVSAACGTAASLGMEIGLFNSPGWSQSGGPWVRPETAMRRFVSSSTVIEGPAENVFLPAPRVEGVPAKEMREVAAIAYPAPPGWCDRLEKKDVANSLLQRKGRPLAVEFDAPPGFVAQGVEADFCDGSVKGFVRTEIKKNGKWTVLDETPFSRVRHTANVGFTPHSPVLASFAPVSAEKFRVSIVPQGGWQSRFSSIAVCGAPVIERAYEKSLAKMFETPLPYWREYMWPAEPAEAPGTSLDVSKAVVLSGKVSAGGRLDWRVPEGKWVVWRFCSAPTGAKNCPANPEATGYEADKMSAAHIASHFDAYLGEILGKITPEGRKAVRHAVLDSYEVGGQNYTDGFAEKFKASFGYDPMPYLPALFGASAGSRPDSDRFLWDLRRFVADEIAYSYVGGLREASNARGIRTWLEPYGHWGFAGEFLQYGGQSDAIGGEFWSEGSLGDIENRAASSCAHIYGKRLVWAESNTCGGGTFGRGPMDLKSRTDRFFADGVNATILHLYVHQNSDRAPGRVASFGNEFNRHNSWFEHFDLFTGYLKRVGWMLRQGLNVADFAYFIGEDAPKMTGLAEPAVPGGSQYDYINAEVLVETAGVDGEGRIVLPHGTSYEVLVLPPLDTMRPRTLEKISRLVEEGAFVLGPKPSRSPSLAGQPAADARVKELAQALWGEVDGKTVKYARRGKGVIAWGLSPSEALAMRGRETDIRNEGGDRLIYAHRTMPKAEIYFVACFGGKPAPNAAVSFRVSGRIPEIWDPATGEIREAESWKAEKGRTRVSFSLARHGSVFVVFAKDAGGRTSSGKAPPAPETLEVPGPWSLSFMFDALHRGPAAPLRAEKPFDLSKSQDPAVRYYSGKVVYKTKFSAPAGFSSAVLDLGDVGVTAKVKIGGREAGGVCFEPYRLDVTKFVSPGENDLEIEVCTLWVNRLVGDAGLKNSPTWTNRRIFKPGSPLKKSGLVGPVRIEFRR